MAPEALAGDGDFSLAKLQLSSSFWRLLGSVLDGVKIDLLLCCLTLPQKMNHISVKQGFYFPLKTLSERNNKTTQRSLTTTPTTPPHRHVYPLPTFLKHLLILPKSNCSKLLQVPL